MNSYYPTYRKATVVSSYDSDAQAFFTATGITDNTQKNAVDALVVGLKADGIWSQLNAIYPFVGGTATTHKFNLKTSLDTDAGFRLVYGGTVTHSSNGFKGNGSNGYADTFLTPSVTLSLDNVSMWLHWTVANSNSNKYTGARSTGGPPYVMLRAGDAGSSFDTWANDSGGTDFASNNPSTGWLGVTRDSSSTLRRYIGSAASETAARTSTSTVNASIYIGGVNNFASYQNATFGFFALGGSLNATDAGNLRTRVETFQTALGR